MRKLHIYTNGYSTSDYTVNLENGNIIQSSRLRDGGTFSNQWKLQGFSHVRRNEFISLARIRDDSSVLERMIWRFKNGKGQYTVRDLDHGTTRQWGERVLGVYFSE